MKKLFALILVLALIASLGVTVFAAEGEEPTGRGEPVARAAAVEALWTMAGQPVVNYALAFTDLDTGASYLEAVRWAAAEGIVNGYDANTFGPDDPTSREQLAVMVYRYAQTLGLGFTGAWYFPLDYADAGEISDWANEAMHWMVLNGKPEAVDGMLLPKAPVTRSELDGVTAAFTGVLNANLDLAGMIVGRWMVAERDGEPVPTNEKRVYTFISGTEAYISASLNTIPEAGAQWLFLLDTDVAISGSRINLINHPDAKMTTAEEYTVTAINDNAFTADRRFVLTIDGNEVLSKEDTLRFVKVDVDYSDAILGTWEGRCVSAGSVFDDGQVHRWEYRADGSYVYYEKDGETWVPGDDTLNEYFVAGNLLCTRWAEGDVEYREWWEIAIEGDTMHWTALRQAEDGSTFTAAFEMTKVEN